MLNPPGPEITTTWALLLKTDHPAHPCPSLLPPPPLLLVLSFSHDSLIHCLFKTNIFLRFLLALLSLPVEHYIHLDQHYSTSIYQASNITYPSLLASPSKSALVYATIVTAFCIQLTSDILLTTFFGCSCLGQRIRLPSHVAC